MIDFMHRQQNGRESGSLQLAHIWQNGLIATTHRQNGGEWDLAIKIKVLGRTPFVGGGDLDSKLAKTFIVERPNVKDYLPPIKEKCIRQPTDGLIVEIRYNNE
eukprot:CAMPEP_0201550826 /NCGR_PEP_ID=MMETSP0173_2-20130828/7121_1 /ASSEMBLY_ACC=CAM_ASM_000268 /TAXON_ID=218659 /ORGANISM="Vexillifera sp., Strain DIVA3 564/2" /LENGTH=102 /DNA_ID=CAMNT_0047960915 /DNA_START=194 /DNA_END=499 /DNA_ORIENTATION=+